MSPPVSDRDASAPGLVRNTVFNGVASLVGLGVGLVLSPVLLATLGVERFGLWSLLWAVTGSLGLVDLRLAAAVTPLAAAAWARGERDRVTRIASTSVVFYGVLGAVEVGAAVLVARFPALVLWLPESLQGEARFAVVAAVAVFALNSVTSVFTSLLQGAQRFDAAARITVTVTVVRGVALAGIALVGGGIAELLLGEAVLAVLQLVMTTAAVGRLFPGLRLARRPDRGVLRELLGFGGKLQIAHLAHLIGLHGDKILLSAFLGLSAVAYYDLGSKIAYVMRGLPLLLISAALPAATALDVAGDRQRLWQFYLSGTRLLVFAATPLFVFTAAGAAPILLVWAGVDAPEARMAVWLLAAGYYLNLLSGMAHTVALGIGRPELELRRSILAAALNIGLSAGLIPVMGFAGAPLGTALAFAVGAVYLVAAFTAEVGGSVVAVARLLYRPVLLAVPAAAGAIFIAHISDPTRAGAALGLVASAALVGALFLWLAVRDGVVSRQWLRTLPALLRPTTPVP
jgi:O-antigen/teichoic acid export membrane protein